MKEKTANDNASFESTHKSLAYLFAAGITLATLPIIGWHAILSVGALAILLICGFAVADLVLWYAAHWSVAARTPGMRVTALVVKCVLAGAMIINASIVFYLLKGDKVDEWLTERAVAQQTEARKAEITARAEAAQRLAGVRGGQQAARSITKMDAAKDAGEIARATRAASRAKLEQYLPAWYLDIGTTASVLLAALVGYVALAISATVNKEREGEREQQAKQAQPGTTNQGHAAGFDPRNENFQEVPGKQ